MVNSKHLRYFWTVAREGGVARASERLNLTPQTISGQLSLLEEHLGVDLFIRVRRNLELTETGRLVLSYTDEIFSLGGELEEMIHQLPEGRPQLFRVGVADVLPKSIAHRILKPALQTPGAHRSGIRAGGFGGFYTATVAWIWFGLLAVRSVTIGFAVYRWHADSNQHWDYRAGAQ